MQEADNAGDPRGRHLARSRAFREASLRSEVRRAYAVMAMIVLVAVGIFLRGSMARLHYRVQLVGAGGLLGFCGVQVATLGVAEWARRRGRGIPTWFAVLTVVAEGLVPTGMMLAHVMVGQFPPYAAMSAPPLLVYGLLIALTTLRLRPALCVLAGAVSAAGYAGLIAYATYGLGVAEPTTGLPRLAYVNSVVLIFAGGVAAAWVAYEIRRHAEAALGEAETRRRMERIEHDLLVARSIQRALLPHAAPDVPGFDIAGWNRPADQTGGDYYDWQKLPDGNWIVTVADVSGHGIGPALVTAACRAYVRASADHHGDLASLASRVNSLLADDLADGRFVTMVSVVINPAAAAVGLLSAGHGPIVLYAGATGVVREIMPQNLPLAVMADEAFGPVEAVELAAGDVLALVTDGFVEWARTGAQGRREEFGISRLRESLRRHAALPAAAMIGAIRDDVAAFAHPWSQQDDLTMVVIRRVV